MKKVGIIVIIILIVIVIAVVVVHAAAQKQISLLKESEFKVDKIKVTKFSLTQAELAIDSSFKNLSDIDFYVTGYSLAASVNNTPTTTANATGLAILIKAKQVTQLPQLLAGFDPVKALTAGIQNLGNANLHITGTITVAYKMFKTSVPVDVTITIKDYLQQ